MAPAGSPPPCATALASTRSRERSGRAMGPRGARGVKTGSRPRASLRPVMRHGPRPAVPALPRVAGLLEVARQTSGTAHRRLDSRGWHGTRCAEDKPRFCHQEALSERVCPSVSVSGPRRAALCHSRGWARRHMGQGRQWSAFGSPRARLVASSSPSASSLFSVPHWPFRRCSASRRVRFYGVVDTLELPSNFPRDRAPFSGPLAVVWLLAVLWWSLGSREDRRASDLALLVRRQRFTLTVRLASAPMAAPHRGRRITHLCARPRSASGLSGRRRGPQRART